MKKYEVIIKLEDLEDKKNAECPHCSRKLEEVICAPYFVVKQYAL